MKRPHSVDLVFALALLGVFAASMLLALLAGARVYRGVADRLEESYAERSCLSYVAAKLRHADTAGAVSLIPFGDGDALLLTETIDGDEYGTVIYLYQGMVRELFTQMPLAFGPETGSEVLPAQSLRFAWLSGNLLRVECRGEGGSTAGVDVALRADNEEALP
jgi:hypothetical protein